MTIFFYEVEESKCVQNCTIEQACAQLFGWKITSCIHRDYLFQELSESSGYDYDSTTTTSSNTTKLSSMKSLEKIDWSFYTFLLLLLLNFLVFIKLIMKKNKPEKITEMDRMSDILPQ
uniref:Apple domain-containing protein n=1 Tax=Panagrolaimus sp. JU765 TaxID=591449 RepID=A0AC34PXS0_9BILA